MADKVEFTGSTHIIKIKTGENFIDVQKDLYSAAKNEWSNEIDNLHKYKFPFIVIGGNNIGGGQKAPSFYFLQFPWKIETNGDGVLHSFGLNLYAQDIDGDPRDPFTVLSGDSLSNETSNIPGSDLLQVIKDNIDSIMLLVPSENEKEQWRESLGIDGTKREAIGGQMQTVKDQSELAAINAVDKLNG